MVDVAHTTVVQLPLPWVFFLDHGVLLVVDVVDRPDDNNQVFEILVVTSPEIPGRKIVRTLGLVSGNTIRARHVGKDIMAGLRNLVGGEVTEYAKLLSESREQALDRMKAKAEKLGANAVISLQFQTSVIMGGAAEMMAYGTAVVLEEESCRIPETKPDGSFASWWWGRFCTSATLSTIRPL